MGRCIALILFVFTSFFSHATEVIHWENRPVKMTLAAGQERVIQFPDHVEIGVPPALQRVVSASSAQGAVFITAHAAFDYSRFYFRLATTGKVIMVDINVVEADKATPALSEKVLVSISDSKQPSPEQQRQAMAQEMDVLSPVELMRFASQMFYAPPRLHKTDPRISRVPVKRNLDLSTLFFGQSYGVFESTLQAAWRTTDGLYLSAIAIVNQTPYKQPILFTDINADYLYATPQHISVGPKNTVSEQTMLFLVSSRPLYDSLYLMPMER